MKILLHPSKEDIQLNSVLYALSDSIRLEIVRKLANGGEHSWASFGNKERVKSTMTHHFKVLREAGVIRTRIEGRDHYRSLRSDDLDDLFPGLLEAIIEAAGGPLALGESAENPVEAKSSKVSPAKAAKANKKKKKNK